MGWKLPTRLRVIVSAYLGCAAAGAAAAVAAASYTVGNDGLTAGTFVYGLDVWLGMQAGPFAAMLSPLGFLAGADRTRWLIWLALVVFTAACILAHPIRPHRRTAVVTTLGMVLWFFLAALLGLWYAGA